jgi:AraC family transcriptional regulator of adaptative response/methylated-DNA-[protein]-cysteine methyltransferase
MSHSINSAAQAHIDAVRRRDAAFDGKFFYGVATTGVYCKPSCASRPARAENLSFHATAEAAERSGFRPCKRCRPNEAEANSRLAEAVRRACRLMETAEETPSLEALAAAACLSPFHFHRVFRKATGVTPRAYAAALKAGRVAEGLRSAASVTEAIYDAGFGSSSRFYETARARLGMTPSELRQGGKGTTIRFAVGQTSLGAIMVAATEAGVCAIDLGEDPGQLVQDLQSRFPQAELAGGDPGFERLVATIVGMVEAPATHADLPLDIRGTAFQQRVWQALRAIPAGTTATYTDIARAVGKPGSVRAVARACASNTLAVAIPCHRVVRLDGSLSGYRWGVERKRALLQREASR